MHFGIPELLREVIGDRLVEIPVIEDRRIEEARKDRLARRHFLRFRSHALPHGIANGKWLVSFGRLRHVPAPHFFLPPCLARGHLQRA